MKRRSSAESDRTQPRRRIAGYLNTLKRSGGSRVWPRVLSLADASGPVFAPSSVAADEADLSCIAPSPPRALGQLITVSGRVLDEAGRPVSGCLMELWHANSAGKYIHHNDPSPVPADPNFRGHGRILTDTAGRFRFRTIKPGGYAVPDDEAGAKTGWWRPPHLHFSLFGANFGARLVTQLFFPGEPLNAHDLILNAIPDASARERLVLRFVPRARRNSGEGDAPLDYMQDFVLRGRFETPFERR